MGNQPEGEWIEWAGGECPVDPDAPVICQLRNETREEAESLYNPDRSDYYRGGEWDWKHFGGLGDIVAYRVVAK